MLQSCTNMGDRAAGVIPVPTLGARSTYFQIREGTMSAVAASPSVSRVRQDICEVLGDDRLTGREIYDGMRRLDPEYTLAEVSALISAMRAGGELERIVIEGWPYAYRLSAQPAVIVYGMPRNIADKRVAAQVRGRRWIERRCRTRAEAERVVRVLTKSYPFTKWTIRAA